MKLLTWIHFDKPNEKQEFLDLMDSVSSDNSRINRLMKEPWNLDFSSARKAVDASKYVKRNKKDKDNE